MTERKRDDDTATPPPDDALARAAEQGPLPGVEDDEDDRAVNPDSQETVGQRPEDEAEEITGFKGR